MAKEEQSRDGAGWRSSVTPILGVLLLSVILAGCLQESPLDETGPSEPAAALPWPLSAPLLNLSEPVTLVFQGPGTFHLRVALERDFGYGDWPPSVPLADTEEGNDNSADHWVIAARESLLAQMISRRTCGLQKDESPPPANLWNPHPTGLSAGYWDRMEPGVWHLFVHVDAATQVFVKPKDAGGNGKTIGAGPKLEFNESARNLRVTSLAPEPKVVSPNAPYRVQFDQLGSTGAAAFLVAYFETRGGPWVDSSGMQGVWSASGEKCAMNSWGDDRLDPNPVPVAGYVLALFVLPVDFDFRWSGYFETPATGNNPTNDIWGHLVELDPA